MRILYIHFFLLLGMLFCGSLSTLSGQSSVVMESEDARFAAQMQRDTMALHHLCHDELHYIHSNGLIEDKSDFIHSVASGKIEYQKMQVRPGRKLWQRGRMAITNGIVQVIGTLNGRSFDVDLFYTAVYRKQRGRWQLLRWQSTSRRK